MNPDEANAVIEAKAAKEKAERKRLEEAAAVAVAEEAAEIERIAEESRKEEGAEQLRVAREVGRKHRQKKERIEYIGKTLEPKRWAVKSIVDRINEHMGGGVVKFEDVARIIGDNVGPDASGGAFTFPPPHLEYRDQQLAEMALKEKFTDLCGEEKVKDIFDETWCSR